MSGYQQRELPPKHAILILRAREAALQIDLSKIQGELRQLLESAPDAWTQAMAESPAEDAARFTAKIRESV